VGVVVPGRPAEPTTPQVRRVLALCDGTRPARAIQRQLAPELSASQVVEILTELVRRRWIVWQLEIPADARAERHLRAFLEQVDDPPLRRRWLDRLDVLEQGRDRVRTATDVDQLCAALADLESGFVALTDTAATREKSAGTAPCRGLVYADSRRSATARLGGDVLTALAPLESMLTAAGWLTSTLTGRLLPRFRQVYDRLRAGTDQPVDLASFWFACMPVLHGDATAEATAVQQEFWRRWADILPPTAGVRRVRADAATVAARVREVFGDAPATSWTAARYLSPDVLIAAEDADAVARGDFQLVLGELHVATNTVGANLFVHQHPAPEELFAATDRDHPGPRLLPVLAKEHRSRLSIRVGRNLVRPEDYLVALVDHTADPRRPRTVLSADVSVVERDDRLVVVLPDGAEFDVLDVFSHVLTTLVMDLFRVLPDADHSPRVTVDRMVVARESWRFVAGELG
ncbi:lantibiotic dehydratase, partial [Micromonospora echinofusca]